MENVRCAHQLKSSGSALFGDAFAFELIKFRINDGTARVLRYTLGYYLSVRRWLWLRFVARNLITSKQCMKCEPHDSYFLNYITILYIGVLAGNYRSRRFFRISLIFFRLFGHKLISLIREFEIFIFQRSIAVFFFLHFVMRLKLDTLQRPLWPS